MNDYLVNVPVMLLFFNRPEPLQRVFNSIKKAKPSMLFLVQDGARSDCKYDEINIAKCREIVSVIDWNCKVFTNYSNVNMSCDHREFTGISWAFKYVDRLIILEDDCVPCESFFGFCQEILERYSNDNRVHMISGLNRMEIYNEIESDYFFSTVGAGWGWATWKRVWERAEEIKNCKFVYDKDTMNNLKRSLDTIADLSYTGVIERGKIIENNYSNTNKVTSWEYILGMTMILNSSLVITPKKNMITNIGLTKDSTHATDNINKLPHKIRKYFFMTAYDVKFPISHPKHVIRDINYEKMHFKMTHTNYFKSKLNKVESLILRILYHIRSKFN